MRSLVAAFTGLWLAASAASAVTYQFDTPIAGDTVPVTLELTDVAGGNAVDVTVSIPAGQGDLLGLFGNVVTESAVPSMAVSSATGVVTQWQFQANQVWKVGSGNVLTPVKSWDFGLRFAQNGSAGGAITSAVFRLTGAGLSVAQLTSAANQGWLLGVRIQSTLGPEGSAKVGLAQGTPPVSGPPTIAIASPASGALLATSPVAVSGSVTAGASVSVNGVAATVLGTSWTASLPLADGPHTITATAANAGGSASASVNVTVDATPPVVTISSPPNGLLTTAALIGVLGTAVDATSAISSFHVNGQGATLSAGEFSTTVTLSLGANTITATATDAAGNTGSASVLATRGVAPAIAISSPANGLLTNATPITVTGTITGTPPIAVAVNGVTATVTGTSFTASVPLTEGANTLTAGATSAFGADNAFVSVTRDSTPPVVTFTGPTNGAQLSVTPTVAMGTVADASPITAIRLNGAAQPPGNAFNGSVQLVEGSNTLTATATDAAGNTGTASITVELATGPPLAITVSTPLNGEIVVKDEIDVAGTVSDARATVRVNGVTATVVSGQYVARQVPVQEGTNTLTATATRGSETASASADVFYNAPPKVLIRTPSPGAELRVATIDVEGTVDDAAAFVDVNGVAAAVDSGGRFVARDVPLTPGANTLAARAIDGFGAQGTDAVDVTRDDEAAPHLRVVSVYGVPFIFGDTITPAFSDLDEYDRALAFGDPAGMLFFPPPVLPVSRADFIPPTTVPVVQNGDLAVLSDRPEPIRVDLFVEGASVPFASSTAPAIPLEQSEFAGASLVAEDAFSPEAFEPTHVAGAGVAFCQPEGNCSPEHIDRAERVTARATSAGAQDELTFDIGPSWDSGTGVYVTSPTSGSTIAGNAARVVGYVGSRLPLLDVARYTVYDTFLVQLEQGTVPLVAETDPSDPISPIKARFVIPEVLLGQGPHIVEIEAWDAGGNRSVSNVGFDVDASAPGVALVAPQNGSATAETSVPVSLNFAADTTLIAVNGVADGRQLPAGLAESVITLPLALGANTLQIDYQNASGAFTETFTIFHAPVVGAPHIASPQDGAYYNTDTVSVRGTVDYGTPFVEVNGVPGVIASDGVSFAATIPVPRTTGVLHVTSTSVAYRPYSVVAISLPFGGISAIEVTPDFQPLPIAVVPQDGSATTDSTVIVSGDVFEPMLVTLETPTQFFTADAKTSFRFEFPAADLAPGANALMVRGRDRAGNIAAQTLNIARVASALDLLSPAAGATLPGFATDLHLTAHVPISLEAVFAQNRLVSGIASPSAPVPIAAGPVHLTNIPLEPGANALRIVYRRGTGPQEVLAFTLGSATSANTYVTGRVISASSGNPIAGATVRVSTGGALQSVYTNNLGEYLVPVVPGAVLGTAEATGHGQGYFTEQAAAFGATTQVADLALASPIAPITLATLYTLPSSGFTQLFGIVREDTTQLGIGGATVTLAINGNTLSTTTASSGAYSFVGIPPGSFSGTIAVAGYNGATFSGGLPFEHSVFLDDARLTAIPGASAGVLARAASGPALTGRVLDAATQATVARADVVVSVAGQAQQGFSNEQGVYLLPITPGALSGSIAAVGYTGADLSGTAGAGHTRMDDALLTTAGPPVAVAAAGAVATSALVVGHVTDSQTGVGIGGALVTIVVNGQTLIGLTDANGDFRFAVEPGSVTGTIVATGYGSSTFTVTVAAGDTVNVNVASNPPVLPPTGLPGLMNEVEILVPPAGTVTDWEKVTVVGTVLRPSSAVTVNGIAATVVGNRFTAKHVDLAMGANTITATATNVGSPAASKTISAERATTPVLAVTIYSPPDGATVPGSGLVVRGFVSAKSARTALTGGMALPDEGVFVQTEVPLPVGSQSIAVLAQSSDGTQEVSSDLPVTVLSAIEAVRLISEPPAGEAPLSVVFDPQAGVPLSIERVDFDLDGDLEPEALDREFEPVSKLFTQPGPTEARVFLTTTEGVELSASAGVRVLLPPIATQPFASGNPVDLALADDGDLWVLDAAAGRLSRFAPDRSLLTEFGSSGSGSGQLRSPLAVAVAPGGNLYVADTGNDRISVFEPDGSLIREFGGSGSALGELRSPSGVAVAAGVVVVSDTGNGRLQVFALDGTPLNTAPIPDPRGIAFAGELGLSVSSPVVGIRQLSVESNGFLRQRPPDGLQPSRILASVDVASGGSGVLVVDASSRSVVDLMEQVVQRTLYGPAARAPLAVVGSARRDVPSLFVADGAQVFEVELPVPSPLPTVAAFKTALAAGDANAALPMIFPLQREDYRQIFAALGASLGPLHGQQLGNATIEYLDERRAVVLIETTVEGANGPELRRIPMQLVRKPSGGWQVYEY